MHATLIDNWIDSKYTATTSELKFKNPAKTTLILCINLLIEIGC